MSSYPDAYCVKCGDRTQTLNKHTVVLNNNSRALTGVCERCSNQVYKILAKKPQSEKKNYPEAFCVKCQTHVKANSEKTVVLANAKRALTGTCPKCSSEVYRIMESKKESNDAPKSSKHELKLIYDSTNPKHRLISQRSKNHSRDLIQHLLMLIMSVAVVTGFWLLLSNFFN